MKDVSRLIKRSSIFSKLGSVDYFSGREDIWGVGTTPSGFTTNKGNSLSSELLNNNQDSIVLTPRTHTVGSGINIYNFGRTMMYPNYIENKPTSLLSITNSGITYVGKFDSSYNESLPALKEMKFGLSHNSSYLSMLGVSTPITLDEYYDLGTLSVRNNPSKYTSWISEPYYFNKIGQRFGVDTLSIGGVVDSSLFRAGITTTLHRAAADVQRISSFLLSPKGLMFITKQVGLQAMSPRPETNIIPLTFAGAFPVNTIASVLTAGSGIRIPRHSVFGASADKYSDSKEVIGDINDNRLVYFYNNNILKDSLELPIRTITTPGISLAAHSIYGIPIAGPTTVNRASTVIGIKTDEKDKYVLPSISEGGYVIKDTVLKKYSDIPSSSKQDSTYENKIKSVNINLNKFPSSSFNMSGSVLFETIVKNYKARTAPKHKPSFVDKLIRAEKNGGLTDDDDVMLISIGTPRALGNVKTFNFRAIVDSFSDTYSPSYSSANYIGNPITYPLYQNMKQTVTIAFKVPIYYSSEIGVVKNKLDSLRKFTYPATFNNQNRMATPYLTFKFGKYFDAIGGNAIKLGTMSSLTYTIDSDVPWVGATVSNDGLSDQEFPMVVSVSMTIDIIPEEIPVAYNITIAQ